MFKNYHKSIYFAGLLLLAISLPLSLFLLSVAQIILMLNWVLENNFKEKWAILKRKESIFAFGVIYLIHIFGMFYSTDLSYGFHDLKIKLPLLVVPIIIGTTQPVKFKQFVIVLSAFCGAVLVSTMISTGRLFEWWGTPVRDVRDISIFISHIRLALMVNLSIFLLLWMVVKSKRGSIKAGLTLLIFWFVFFLIILKSVTGIAILLIMVVIFSLWWIKKLKSIIAKWFLVVGFLMGILIGATYISHSIAKFNYVEKIDFAALESHTINGNPYSHDLNSKDSENGNLAWIYVCETELENAWNKLSSLKYYGKDLKGQDLKYTLIRYLTSKGLRKDSAGIANLTSSDIVNIENGMANHIFSHKFSFYPRIYQLLWEIRNYKNGGNPSSHSFTQRIEYLNTAVNIIKSNFWLGVGTGDVALEFKNQYERDKSQLEPRWRLRAHNQLVTFLLTFGIIGFDIIFISLIYPIYKERKWNNYFMLVFIIISFLSFLNEDTLETHAGISFYSFFIALFLYNTDVDDKVGRVNDIEES